MPSNSAFSNVAVLSAATYAACDGPEAMRRAVRFNFKYGADVIKFCA